MDAGSSTLVLTAYAKHLSMLTLRRLVADAFGDLPGSIVAGEMALRDGATGGLLPTSLYVRRSRDARDRRPRPYRPHPCRQRGDPGVARPRPQERPTRTRPARCPEPAP